MKKLVKTALGHIEYRDIGTGKPVLFLHGGHSNCDVELFQRGYDTYRLIIPSRPGYGKTPLSNFKTPAEASVLIKSLLDYLKIDTVIVVGISAGGLTAIALSSVLERRAEKLILISAITKKWLLKTEIKFTISRIVFHPRVEWLTWFLLRLCFKLFPIKMAKLFCQEFSKLTHQHIDENDAIEIEKMISKQRSKKGFLNDIKQDTNENVMATIKCPTLLLHSVNDASVTIDMAMYAYARIPGSVMKMYDNKWGHLLWLGNDSEAPIKDLHHFLTKTS